MKNINRYKILIIFFASTFLISCAKKDNNIDFDFSTLKKSNKLKISSENDKESKKIDNFENKLLPYKEKSEVLNSVKIGKKDPFAKESEVNKFSTILKLTGFADTGFDKYVFVSFQNNNGTITEGSVGGVSTNLLPNGAKVINLDSKNMQLTIDFDNETYIFGLQD